MEEREDQLQFDGEPDAFEQEEDHFSRFMFGSRRYSKEEKIAPEPVQPAIDYGELMIHIDALVESAQNLKPLVQHLYPKVLQFLKKK